MSQICSSFGCNLLNTRSTRLLSPVRKEPALDLSYCMTALQELVRLRHPARESDPGVARFGPATKVQRFVGPAKRQHPLACGTKGATLQQADN